MPTEIELLEGISKTLTENKAASDKELKEIKTVMDEQKKAEVELKAEVDKLQKEVFEKGGAIADAQKEILELKAKGGRFNSGTGRQPITINALIVETLEKHKDQFALAKNHEVKGIGVGMDVLERKAVGPILSANLTGTGNNYISYLDWQPGMEPLGQFHFRDIFRTIQSDTDFVRFPRANVPIGEGSFARVPEGQVKPQVDRDYTMIDLTLQAMAGFAIVSRQSLRNIIFLQSWLPTSMMEQLLDAEDTDFANTLVAAATGSTVTTGYNDTSSFGKLIAYMTILLQNKFKTNFIAGDAKVWANLLTLKSSGSEAFYQQPGFVSITADGQVRVLGIPFYPVNWLTGGRILTGDSRKAAIVQSEGLTLRQSDSHASIFTSNEIAFLLERVEGLAVFRPDAFQTAVFT